MPQVCLGTEGLFKREPGPHLSGAAALLQRRSLLPFRLSHARRACHSRLQVSLLHTFPNEVDLLWHVDSHQRASASLCAAACIGTDRTG